MATAKFKRISYSSGNLLRYSFLKACRVSFHMPEIPRVMRNYGFPTYLLRDIEFFCDAVEFPGKALQTVEAKVAGTNRAKVPILRTYNEINLSFYHPADTFPVFDYFSTWIEQCAPRDSKVAYYDDIVLREGIQLTQWEPSENTVNFAAILTNAFPTSVMSLQGNWSDEGFQKVNITMTYEDYEMANDVGTGSINTYKEKRKDLERRARNTNPIFISPDDERLYNIPENTPEDFIRDVFKNNLFG